MSDNSPRRTNDELKSQYRDAIESLRHGGLVALPTDTVYGLCAVATSRAAVTRLYRAKQRPLDQPLPLFVGSIEQARIIADVNDTAEKLMQRFWPGALTIVLPKRDSYHTLAAADTETIGIRQPGDPLLCEIALQLGPITSTSANLSGEPECHTADAVREQLGDTIDAVVETHRNHNSGGTPSTVVDATKPGQLTILREAAITKDDLATALPGITIVVKHS